MSLLVPVRRLDSLPPTRDILHLGQSYHLHPSHCFLSTWGAVRLGGTDQFAEGNYLYTSIFLLFLFTTQNMNLSGKVGKKLMKGSFRCPGPKSQSLKLVCRSCLLTVLCSSEFTNCKKCIKELNRAVDALRTNSRGFK